MEETLKWLVTMVQEMQQSQLTERQALMIWQAGQQQILQEFIREQSETQQILQKMVNLALGDAGVGLCKMGPTDDPDASLGTFEWVTMVAGLEWVTWALQLGEAPKKANTGQGIE